MGVSYVDHQLRSSRRFDAAGLERDHPELFLPFPRRRSSSSNSLSSSSTGASSRDDSTNETGQLRYWTADMCTRSPHLFDFVVTVRYVITLVPYLMLRIRDYSWVAMAQSCSLHGFSSV